MTWYDHEDRTKPVIDPRTQIASKYPDMKIPELPSRAVVFCLGKGLSVLKEHFPCRPVMEKLPGFITHSEVLGIEGVSGLGLMIGVKTVKPAREVVMKCLENGALYLTAKDRVRLLPALNIPMDLLERAIAVLKEACR